MNLRPYQKEAVTAIEEQWREGNSRTLLAAATGTGKTVIMSELANHVAYQGGRTLILAHRGELLDQATDKIERMTGLTCAREQAGSTGVGTVDKVVVGSVQTMMREKRLAAYDPYAFSHIFIDEAHHAVADSYLRVLDRFPDSKVLGVTATADRADKKALSQVFDSIAYEYGMKDAIEDGYLCPIQALMLPVHIDISKVQVKAGDYDAQQLGNALEPYLDDIANQMVEKCNGRRTVVFLPLVKMAKDFADLLTSKGLRACEVDGGSSDRAEVLTAFQNGEYDVICNAMLLTEGWDCPSVDCIVVLRPTRSRALYQQMVGRGTRLSPGKEHLLLLDFLWMSEHHNLCRPASLLGANGDVTERVEAAIASGVPIDLLEAEGRAVVSVQAEREKALREKLEAMRHRRAKLVDPMQFAFSICDIDLQDYEPMFPWERQVATQKQVSMLERRGIDANGMSRGMASKLIGAIIERTNMNLATPRQVMQLERFGFVHPGTWSFAAASSVMEMLASNNWKVPSGIDPSAYVPAG